MAFPLTTGRGQRDPFIKERPVHLSPRRQERPLSMLVRLRLPKAIRELENACREALEQSWHELDRKRAREIALALSEALRLEGIKNAAVLARSLGSLMGLSKDQIRPIESALREKVRELLKSLRATVDGLLTLSGS